MTRHEIDDAAAERLLRGSAADGQERLGLLLSQLRSMSNEAPEPSSALAAMLRDGFPASPAAAPAPEASRWGRRFAAVAGMSLAVKVLAGAGVAVAAVGTAAGAGVLPEPVRDGVSSVVRTLTPFELDGTDEAPTPPPVRPAPLPPAPPTLPTPAPMDTPARGTAPQDLPTGAPGVGDRRAPSPVAPGAERRPGTPPQSEQRPQPRTEAPARPSGQGRAPQGADRDRERPASAPTPAAGPAAPPAEGDRLAAESADLQDEHAADARVTGSLRR